MWGQYGRATDPSPRSDQVSGKSSISLPRDLTTVMTPWRFEGASDPNRQKFRVVPAVRRGRLYLFGAGAGVAAGGGAAAGRGGRAGAPRGRGGGRCRSRGRLRLRRWIDPAAMDAAVQRVRDLGIDLAAKPGQATERRLDMAAGTAETVVQIEVTKGGIEVVEPHQTYDPATEPDAFGVSRRAIEDLGGFGELVGLVLVGFLGGVGRLGAFAAALPGCSWGCASPLWAAAFRHRSRAQARRRRGGAKPHFEAQAPVDA